MKTLYVPKRCIMSALSARRLSRTAHWWLTALRERSASPEKDCWMQAPFILPQSLFGILTQ